MKRLAKLRFVFVTILLIVLPAAASAQAELNKTNPPPLSKAQVEAIKSVKAVSARQAILPSLRLARIVRQIYDNMLAAKPNEKLRMKLSAELKDTTWQLLTIKGQAIRETVNLLTPEQKSYLKTQMSKPGAPADLGELIDKTFGLEK